MRAAGATVGGTLRLVPGGLLSGARVGQGEVRLVREFKGPRVDEMLAAAPEVVDRLPGVVRTMHEAVLEGDLEVAEARLDEAVGSLLTGPGSERRRGLSRRQRRALALLVAAVAAGAGLWWAVW